MKSDGIELPRNLVNRTPRKGRKSINFPWKILPTNHTLSFIVCLQLEMDFEHINIHIYSISPLDFRLVYLTWHYLVRIVFLDKCLQIHPSAPANSIQHYLLQFHCSYSSIPLSLPIAFLYTREWVYAYMCTYTFYSTFHHLGYPFQKVPSYWYKVGWWISTIHHPQH